jgi:hypothetical protein
MPKSETRTVAAARFNRKARARWRGRLVAREPEDFSNPVLPLRPQRPEKRADIRDVLGIP